MMRAQLMRPMVVSDFMRQELTIGARRSLMPVMSSGFCSGTSCTLAWLLAQ
jgi:hypothetical protein